MTSPQLICPAARIVPEVSPASQLPLFTTALDVPAHRVEVA
jgi:hypothetical protein